jgi:hypothetical protein
MHVDKTNLRDVLFDCPWSGHLADPDFRLVNAAAPSVLGLRCVKCGALIYVMREQASALVGADGAPIDAPMEPAALPPAEVN